MKTDFKIVEFNTGKLGVRFFNFNPFNLGWWYLYKSKTGETVGVAKLSYFSDSGVQFSSVPEALQAINTFQSQRKSNLKIVKE